MNSGKMFIVSQSARMAVKLPTAAERCKDLRRFFPEYADDWHFLGMLFSQKGQYELSAAAIHKSLNIKPENPVILTNLREAHSRAGDVAAAYRQIGLLELIVNSAKDYIDLVLELGVNTEYRAAMSA